MQNKLNKYLFDTFDLEYFQNQYQVHFMIILYLMKSSLMIHISNDTILIHLNIFTKIVDITNILSNSVVIINSFFPRRVLV